MADMTNLPPTVLLFDPITWVQDWDYSIEGEALAAAGVELVDPPDRATRDRALATADVVVVSSVEELDASHIRRLERCAGILCYSAGMDAVDLAAAAAAGIPVANVRAGTGDVADHAIMLLLAAWRRLPTMTATTAEGWDLDAHPELWAIPRLAGRTVGILGAGAIGRAVAARARAFDVRTIATYRRPEAAEADLPHVDVTTLFAESDAVVLTASLNESTAGIVDRRLLEHARPGIVLVNVGRGGLVVEADLADALDRGIVGCAALDVRDPEPPIADQDMLTGRPDVISTPHVAGVTADALVDLHRLAVEGVVGLLRSAGRL